MRRGSRNVYIGAIRVAVREQIIETPANAFPRKVSVVSRKMQPLLLIFSFACLLALSGGAITATEPKLLTKLAPVNSASYEDTAKDLTAAASDRTFHISKDYGQLGYGGSVPYGTYYGSNYGSGQGYRGTGLYPGYLNIGYNRGYGPNGIVGGGQLGYGYYGNIGYNPGYGGGYGSGYGNGLGYGGYGSYNTGSYGSGYDDGYNGYGRGGYGRYGGSDGYGYGSGYGGYGGSNYGSTYGYRNNYEPYNYQGGVYGTYSYPSGYRGYS